MLASREIENAANPAKMEKPTGLIATDSPNSDVEHGELAE